MNKLDYSQSSALIVYHDSVFGPPHELRDFLLSVKIKQLVCIGHQNRYVKDNPVDRSYIEHYQNQQLNNSFRAPKAKLPEALQYIRDILLTLAWSFKYAGRRTTFYIGLGNLNAFAGIILKLLGRVDTVVYYVIDYIPERFNNPVLNSLYHSLDAFCATHADITWNYAKSMIDARNKKWNRIFTHQIVVGNGVHVRQEVLKNNKKMISHELIYVGTLYEQQGIQLVIESLPHVIQKVPDVSFSLIGSGPFLPELKRLVNKLGLKNCVHFLGFIKDPVAMEKRLARGAVGVAMYKPSAGFVTFTEPGKVKRYLACGLPVIMTDVSPLARQLVQLKCGWISAYDPHDFAALVLQVFKNPPLRKQAAGNAISFARLHDWKMIFENAFDSTVK